MKKWDIIGDIHGQASKLETLLGLLGYIECDGVYRHPERRVLFVGDYIDRGPAIRRVLQIVRAMVDAGEAVALAGNHEVNAVHYHTLGPDGQPLRRHSREKVDQHAATLEQFAGCEREWNEWLGWFVRLPLFFETDDFRAIHACWSDEHIKDVCGRELTDREFLFATADKSRPEGRAITILVKGPELALPPGVTLKDKNGVERKSMRLRWWNLPQETASYAALVMPPGSPAPEGSASKEELLGVPDYPSNAKTVFCGHYWLPYEGHVAALAGNIVCMDYSAGKDGPLVACRWNNSLEKSEFRVTRATPTLLCSIGEGEEPPFSSQLCESQALAAPHGLEP
jgi:Calcineurin-like phosphoesterase